MLQGSILQYFRPSLNYYYIELLMFVSNIPLDLFSDFFSDFFRQVLLY